MWVWIWIKAKCTTLCDKVSVSLGLPVSSTNKTHRHDIAEILLKVALNNINLNQKDYLQDKGENILGMQSSLINMFFFFNLWEFIQLYFEYYYIFQGDKDGETFGFKLDNHKMAKRLWKTCVEHHAFFRWGQTFRLKNLDTIHISEVLNVYNFCTYHL